MEEKIETTKLLVYQKRKNLTLVRGITAFWKKRNTVDLNYYKTHDAILNLMSFVKT